MPPAVAALAVSSDSPSREGPGCGNVEVSATALRAHQTAAPAAGFWGGVAVAELEDGGEGVPRNGSLNNMGLAASVVMVKGPDRQRGRWPASPKLLAVDPAREEKGQARRLWHYGCHKLPQLAGLARGEQITSAEARRGLVWRCARLVPRPSGVRGCL